MMSPKELPADWNLVKIVNGRMKSNEKWKFCKQAFAEQQNRLKEASVKLLKYFEMNFELF